MSMGGSTFVGFGIRIDILHQAALFAFQQLSLKAAALAVAISSVVGEFLEFEKAMADVERMMSVTIGSMQGVWDATGAVREQILQMSSDSIYSVQQLSEAYSFLLRAGLSVEQAMSELWRTEQLALATGMELNEAAETRIRLIKMWGAELTEQIGLNDQLVKIEQLYTMTTEQLTDAMNHAGAIAKLAGLSFAQTAVTIGELVAAGITATTAGTTLRSVLYKLLAPTDAVKEAMAGLGLSVSYVMSLPIDERMQVVAQSILSAGINTEQAAVALEIFGIRGSNIAAILDVLATSWDNQALAIYEATGSAALAAQVFRENLSTRLTELSNALTVGVIRFGEWISQAENAVVIAGVLAIWYFALTTAKTAESTATWGQVIAEKAKAVASATGLSFIWASIQATYFKAMGLMFLRKKIDSVTVAEMGEMAASGSNIVAKGAASIMTIIYSSTLGILTGALKVAASAARGLKSALGPLGIILMIVGIVLGYIIKNTQFMTMLMDILNPIMQDFAEIWQLLKVVFVMLMAVLKPILKMLATILMPILKILMIPLKIIMGVLKVVLGLLAPLIGIIAILANAFAMIIGPGTIFEKIMVGIGKAVEWVGKIITIVVDVIIIMINAIIWFLNLFGANIEMLKTSKEMAEEGERKKKEKDLDEAEKEALEEELTFDEDVTTSPEAVSPYGPTETEDTGTGGGGYGGGGTGGGAVSITIYITADISDLMDEEAFAEYVANYAMTEVARQRGAGVF